MVADAGRKVPAEERGPARDVLPLQDRLRLVGMMAMAAARHAPQLLLARERGEERVRERGRHQRVALAVDDRRGTRDPSRSGDRGGVGGEEEPGAPLAAE